MIKKKDKIVVEREWEVGYFMQKALQNMVNSEEGIVEGAGP